MTIPLSVMQEIQIIAHLQVKPQVTTLRTDQVNCAVTVILCLSLQVILQIALFQWTFVACPLQKISKYLNWKHWWKHSSNMVIFQQRQSVLSKKANDKLKLIQNTKDTETFRLEEENAKMKMLLQKSCIDVTIEKRKATVAARNLMFLQEQEKSNVLHYKEMDCKTLV